MPIPFDDLNEGDEILVRLKDGSEERGEFVGFDSLGDDDREDCSGGPATLEIATPDGPMGMIETRAIASVERLRAAPVADEEEDGDEDE